MAPPLHNAGVERLLSRPKLESHRTAQGRALLLTRRRRRAGMLRIAVGRWPAARHPTKPPASGTHAGHNRKSAGDCFAASDLGVGSKIRLRHPFDLDISHAINCRPPHSLRTCACGCHALRDCMRRSALVVDPISPIRSGRAVHNPLVLAPRLGTDRSPPRLSNSGRTSEVLAIRACGVRTGWGGMRDSGRLPRLQFDRPELAGSGEPPQDT